jgi:undecaprenyl phosphate N,N'-diacetylbacillosamine 1-phosphate transferase
MQFTYYERFGKRFLDFGLATFCIIILSPVFIILFLVLLVNNKGNPFFYQNRPGKNEKIFKLIKFRTMNNRRDKDGNLLSDNARLTYIGRIIRSLSLDEIPQFLNILKGEMSLIGPRPLLVSYLHLYSDYQRKRHNVRPGVTGWAQVNGRNAISWEQKFKYDVWYVENISFFLDLKIAFLTIIQIFRRHGINANLNTTMEPFKG